MTLTLYALVAGALLLLPWPAALLPFIIGLLLLLVFELRHRLHLQQHWRGLIFVEESRCWHWRQQQGLLARPPFILPFGILLSLRTPQGKKFSLWLMRDSMSEISWRALRRLLQGYT